MDDLTADQSIKSKKNLIFDNIYFIIDLKFIFLSIVNTIFDFNSLLFIIE